MNEHTEKELQGKVSLVTGASRGLGRAIALRLAAMGSKVAVNYVSNDAEAAKAVGEIEAAGGQAMLAKANVADAGAVKAMTQSVIDRWGRIDILVNNAGITRDALLMRMSDEAWDDVLNTNLRGAYLCTKFAMRSMMAQFWGRVVNISSVGGLVGNVGQANYSAAKGGLIAFTKSLARELGSRNITANVIAPGFITTEMTARLPKERQDEILARIPLKRFGRPQDVAELAGFLATERASYITAQVICVDGGVM
ncbi:MAG: 3-oxoacyl-[acyl-carrier-protein] reductase [Chloroflexi bacterium]|nr:3-oxoacyl-[acyl-carrier-protein] reductase [Chloroflexota bacterium]